MIELGFCSCKEAAWEPHEGVGGLDIVAKSMVHFLNVGKIMMSLMETVSNISRKLEYMLKWLVKTIWKEKIEIEQNDMLN